MYSRQEQLTIDRFNLTEVAPLVDALRAELAKESLSLNPDLTFGVAFVSLIRACDDVAIVKVFYAIHEALQRVPRSGFGDPSLRQMEEAAVTAFLLAALALVDTADAGRDGPPDQPRVERVEDCNPLVCALIAAALFPGELGLEPGAEPEEARPSHYHEIEIAPGSDQVEIELQRAVFFALFPLERRTNETTQESGPLTDDQLGRLELQIERTLRKGKRLTLVAKGFASGERFEAFAAEFKVPVLLPSRELKSRIRGMRPGKLYAHLRDLWQLCINLKSHRPTHPDRGASSKPHGEPPMPSPTIHIHGPGAVTFGDRSPAQSGQGTSADTGDRTGVAPAELIPLLQRLQQGIKIDAGVAPGRKEMDEQAATALAEASKGEKADPGVIKNALVRINDVAQITEQGNKIAGVARQAYNILAPHFNWPTLP